MPNYRLTPIQRDRGRHATAIAAASHFLHVDIDAEVEAARQGMAGVLSDETARQGVTAEVLERVTGVSKRKWAEVLAGHDVTLEWLVLLARLLGYRMGAVMERVDARAAPPLAAIAGNRPTRAGGVTGEMRDATFRELYPGAYKRKQSR